MSWFSKLFSRDLYREMTDAVNAWFGSIYKPDGFYDAIDIDLRVHLCGSEAVIEKKAGELYKGKVDYEGTAGLALPIKINGRWHIFALAAEVGFLQREANPFTVGHETGHIVDFVNEQMGEKICDYVNPDNGRA